MTVTVYIGSKEKLNKELWKDEMVVITSDYLDVGKPPTAESGAKQDNTAVNLIDMYDYIHLHISIRRDDDCIVFNSRHRNCTWYDERPVYGLKRLFGPDLDSAVIEVEDHWKNFIVYTNNNFVINYSKRIGGSIGASYIGYNVNSGHTSVLANPIRAEVVDTPLRVSPRLLRRLT